MPPIDCSKDVLDKLYKHVSPSVVSVNTYESKGYKLDFTTGFIIYSESKRSLICVHKSAINGKDILCVHFSDGTTEKATVFLDEIDSGHAILVTKSERSRARTRVSFSQSKPEREEIFTIAEAEGGYSGFNFMTGTIVSPSCRVIDRKSRKVDPESVRKFALTCPAAILHVEETKRQILGAAVFDLEGSLIGTICSLDEKAYDLKFAQQVYHWVNKLEAKLKAIDVKISLSKKVKKASQPSSTKKRKLEDYNAQVEVLEEKGSTTI